MRHNDTVSETLTQHPIIYVWLTKMIKLNVLECSAWRTTDSQYIIVYWTALSTFISTHVHRIIIVIVIVNSKLLKRHSKAKRRAPAYSRARRQIRGVFQ